MKKTLLTLLTLASSAALAQTPPTALQFYGAPTSSIASGVVIPAGKAAVYTSGTVPALANKDAAVGSKERFGDTKTQAISIMGTIETQLKALGLGLKDVVYLRIYIVPDKNNENKVDYQGWFDAYAQFFNTPQNPIKTARSTLAVHSLVNPDWLIEIEAVAVFP